MSDIISHAMYQQDHQDLNMTGDNKCVQGCKSLMFSFTMVDVRSVQC